MEIQILARLAITTYGGLCIAEEGTKGVAFVGECPTQTQNIGRVAVQWEGKNRIYWVDVDDLILPLGVTPELIVSRLPKKSKIDLPEYPKSSFHFGTSLRMFRKARGLGQSALAERMGGTVGQTTISFWERKSECPSGDFVKSVADALNIPPFFFFVGNGITENNHTEQFMEGLCENVEDGLTFLKLLKEKVCG